MVRHLQYLDDEGNNFNCAFTSEFIEISKENCIKGHAYLLTLKTAVCIYDINGRLTDYRQELFDTDESVHVWLRKVYKKRKSMIGKIKRPETKNLHLETNTSIEQSKVIDEINKLDKEIALLGIKLPFIGNIGFVRNEIVDKISAVIGAQLKKGERLVSPWFSVHGVPHYKFTPEYITHNNVGFRMSLSRLNINMAALCETMKTCIKYKQVNIEKSNKALEKLALVNATLNDISNKTDKTKLPLKDISDKSTLAFDQAYFGGLRSLHFNLKDAANSLYNQIKTWSAINTITRDSILAELGAKVEVKNGQNVLVFTEGRRRSQSPPSKRQRIQIKPPS